MKTSWDWRDSDSMRVLRKVQRLSMICPECKSTNCVKKTICYRDYHFLAVCLDCGCMFSDRGFVIYPGTPGGF